jgi:copper chaperone CopZ
MDVKGVKATDVSLENGTANVLCDQSVKPEQLIQAVEKAGFGAKLNRADPS